MIFFTVKKKTWEVFFKMTRLALVLLGAGIATGIFACSTMEIEEERAPQVAPVSNVQSQAPDQQKAPQPQTIIKETTLEQQPFKLQELVVNEGRGQTTIRLKFSNPVTQYRHFPLTMPSRIVVDIYGEAKRLTQVENFRADTHWLSGLRLSSGEGYLRLVIEITAATVPTYVVEPDNSGLRVVIGPVDNKLTAKKDVQLVQAGKRTDVAVAEAKPGVPETGAKAATVQTPLAAEKKYTGQRISLDFKDADIRNIFRLLAEVSGLNIVVTGDVTKRVTLRLVDVPWDQALDLLVETNGLGKEQLGNVIRISTAEQLKKESDARAAAFKAKENEEVLQTAYFSVNYAKVKDLLDKIKPVLSSRGTIVADDRSNTVIVRDIKKGIDEANTVVSRLDTRTPQVQIESNLIETTPTFARALGIQLSFDAPIHGNPLGSAASSTLGAAITGQSVGVRVPFPAGSPAGNTPFFTVLQHRLGVLRNLNAQLSAAENEGNIRIISRPSVVTLNNVASTIQSLRILRITLPTSTNIATGTGAAAGSAVATERIPVGIILTVTPQVSSDGFVLMNISVKSSSVAANATVAGGTAGVVPFDELSREALANVLVRDGETIVIGGIMKDTSATTEQGIPYLKDIPVVGWLFKNIRWQKDFEELMVFITPRIVSGGSENLPTAEELWREQLKKTEGAVNPSTP